MPIRLISISIQNQRAYINYNDDFGNWMAEIYLEKGNEDEQLVKMLTPDNATTTLNSFVVSLVAQLLLGRITTLGEPALYIDPKSHGYVVSSYPLT